VEPSTPEEWVEVAKERSQDARNLSDGKRSLGAVYMAGYSVECYLKAYLQKNGISQPPRGKEGHNLRGLWSAASFRLSDLSDSGGNRTYFLDSWDTRLRYQAALEPNLSADDLMRGAQELAGLIQKRLRSLVRRSR
jgi:HEPN domain-containing protein